VFILLFDRSARRSPLRSAGESSADAHAVTSRSLKGAAVAQQLK